MMRHGGETLLTQSALGMYRHIVMGLLAVLRHFRRIHAADTS